VRATATPKKPQGTKEREAPGTDTGPKGTPGTERRGRNAGDGTPGTDTLVRLTGDRHFGKAQAGVNGGRRNESLGDSRIFRMEAPGTDTGPSRREEVPGMAGAGDSHFGKAPIICPQCLFLFGEAQKAFS